MFMSDMSSGDGRVRIYCQHSHHLVGGVYPHEILVSVKGYEDNRMRTREVAFPTSDFGSLPEEALQEFLNESSGMQVFSVEILFKTMVEDHRMEALVLAVQMFLRDALGLETVTA